MFSYIFLYVEFKHFDYKIEQKLFLIFIFNFKRIIYEKNFNLIFNI